MAGMKLDGAGTAKMAVLEESLGYLQRIHGLVEQWALAVKKQQSTSVYGLQIRRAATPLVGLLKPQYGLLSDQATAIVLFATRSGGGDQAKVRGLREQVALLRQAIEIAQNKVKEQHAVAIETAGE